MVRWCDGLMVWHVERSQSVMVRWCDGLMVWHVERSQSAVSTNIPCQGQRYFLLCDNRSFIEIFVFPLFFLEMI